MRRRLRYFFYFIVLIYYALTTQKCVLGPKKTGFFRHHAIFFLTTLAVFLWFLGVYNMVGLHGFFTVFMYFLKNAEIPMLYGNPDLVVPSGFYHKHGA